MPASVRMVAGEACSRVPRRRSRQTSRHLATDRGATGFFHSKIKHGSRLNSKLVNAAINIAAVDQTQKSGKPDLRFVFGMAHFGEASDA